MALSTWLYLALMSLQQAEWSGLGLEHATGVVLQSKSKSMYTAQIRSAEQRYLRNCGRCRGIFGTSNPAMEPCASSRTLICSRFRSKRRSAINAFQARRCILTVADSTCPWAGNTIVWQTVQDHLGLDMNTLQATGTVDRFLTMALRRAMLSLTWALVLDRPIGPSATRFGGL